MDARLLLEELIGRGLVTGEQIEKVAANPLHNDKPIERALIDEGLLEESLVLALMSDLFDLPLIELTPELLDLDLGAEIPRRMLETYCIFPLRRAPGSEVLPLATNDPLDVMAEDAVRLLTGRKVEFVLAPRQQIESAIRGTLMGSRGFRILVEQMPEVEGLEDIGSILESERGELSENAAPIIRLVNSMLLEAIRERASDIHVEPRENSFRVRYRIDGVMTTVAELPKRAEKTCVSRIKIMSGIDITETRKAQDGRLSAHGPEGKVNLRVSTMPSQFGEKVVLRILDQTSASLALHEIGLSPEHLQELRSHVSSSNGMVLITGPTGSGKSTTLYAVLRKLNSPEVNIVTVEDPVEFQLDGVTQVQVNPRAGLTFASTLRSFLRQDPDIIMVGEIRDLETAETAVQAAQTGHLVLSTLHTNDAPSTLSRMLTMGIEPHQLSDCLLCVVAQRLVRRLCQDCMAPSVLRPEQHALLSLAEEQVMPARLFHPRGCTKCGGKGYRGRIGLYELLTVTSSLRHNMLIDASESALWQVARSEGMVTLLEDGIRKVQAGLTSIDEVLRAVTIRRIPERTSMLKAATVMAVRPQPLDHPQQVQEVMASPVICLPADTTLKEAAQRFLREGIWGAPVVEDEQIVGVVSFRDLATSQLLHQHSADVTVRQIMSPRILSVRPDDSSETARQMLRRHKVHRLLVMEHGRLVGILTPFDLSESAEPAQLTPDEPPRLTSGDDPS